MYIGIFLKTAQVNFYLCINSIEQIKISRLSLLLYKQRWTGSRLNSLSFKYACNIFTTFVIESKIKFYSFQTAILI